MLSESSKTANPIKLAFLCSPGNPTGTQISLDDVRSVLSNPDYGGLVVVDEAYVDFTEEGTSAIKLLVEEGWSNLVIMQTLSKGFGLAAIRFVERPCSRCPFIAALTACDDFQTDSELLILHLL